MSETPAEIVRDFPYQSFYLASENDFRGRGSIPQTPKDLLSTLPCPCGEHFGIHARHIAPGQITDFHVDRGGGILTGLMLDGLGDPTLQTRSIKGNTLNFVTGGGTSVTVAANTTTRAVDVTITASLTGTGTANALARWRAATILESAGLLTDGQIFIGSTGLAPVAATLTQGTGMTITNAAGAITVALTTPVSLANGGTAAAITADLGAIVYSTASALALLASTATASRMLQSGASAAPTWSTSTWPATTTINQVLYSTAANAIGASANFTFDGTTLTALQQLRVGSATDTATQGDFVAGLTAAARLFFDQSVPEAILYSALGAVAIRLTAQATSETVFNDNAASVNWRVESTTFPNALLVTGSTGGVEVQNRLRVGTATDDATQGDFAAGLTGAARLFYDQSLAALYLLSVASPKITTTTAELHIAGTSPQLFFDETDAIVDNKLWDVLVDGGNLSFRVVNDANIAAGTALRLNRSGISAQRVEILSYLTIGTATDSAASGDLSAGLTGAARLFYDQSDRSINLYDAAGLLRTILRAVPTGGGIQAGLSLDAGFVQINDRGDNFGAQCVFDSGANPEFHFYCVQGTGSFRFYHHRNFAGTVLATDPIIIGNDDLVTIQQRLNVGTATDAAAQGDFSAGLTGGNRLFWDRANKTASLIDSTGTRIKLLAGGESFTDGTLCVGTTATLLGESLIVHQPGADASVLNLTRADINDDTNEVTEMGRAATTDAVAKTLLTIPITASRTYIIEARVWARRTGGLAGTAEDAAGYVIRGSYKTVAGVVTLVGAVNADYTAEDQAAWDATLVISGTNVIVQVTGAANNNIVWQCVARVSYVGT